VKQTGVLEKVYEPGRLWAAWQRVRKNAGAAGIDEMTVAAFEARQEELLELIQVKLKAGTYRFKPARRVLIPKEGSRSKKRKLGIPVVMDRVVSQSIHTVFEEIFGPDFTVSNFGYQRGKSQHQAIRHVQRWVRKGYEWCASIDLASFFDEIPHGLILKLMRRKISDERLVTLVARALKAGVVVEGKFEKTTRGCPQGSPLSPMLSNIVLNELDHELERRGLKYARWADDSVILLRSERAAHRVMAGCIRYLEEELGLRVNHEKSEVAPIQAVTFLGFQILRGKIRVSDKARMKFKARVRALTRRNNPLSMFEVIQQLNSYLRGWVGYFRIHEFRKLFGELDGWIRSRLRSTQLKKWKKPRKFQRVMIKAGFPPEEARRTWVKMNKWQSVNRTPVRFVLNLEWFRRLGLLFLHDYTLATPGTKAGR
jgi:group II intron reverse transcriptase/maturase